MLPVEPQEVQKWFDPTNVEHCKALINYEDGGSFDFNDVRPEGLIFPEDWEALVVKKLAEAAIAKV